MLFTGPDHAEHTLLLAHGAGQGSASAFMQAIAEGLGGRGIRVARFDFPYMEKTVADGRRRPPDRQPVLLDAFRARIAELDGAGCPPARLLIGGKSMGGRMASLIADEAGVAGLVCLGYPFHPPGKPERTRTQHLETLRTRTLICQGERDPFGRREEVESYALAPSIRVHWLPDGDHGFKPRRASGRTANDNLADAIAAVAGFVHRH